MKNINYQFLESYIRIEKFCNEIYNEKNGVTSYIEEMKSKNFSVTQDYYWEDDLDRLKKYRHIRNKMVHEVDGFDYENCSQGDIAWLDDFYNKLMTGDDPLSRYRKMYQTRQQFSKKRNINSNEAYDVMKQEVGYKPDWVRKSKKTKALYVIIAVVVSFVAISAVVFLLWYCLS